MSKNTGGPAFPITMQEDPRGGVLTWNSDGMTLRDYFAAKAMQAFLSSPNSTQAWIDAHCVRSAYNLADAMLVARGSLTAPDRLAAAAPDLLAALQWVYARFIQNAEDTLDLEDEPMVAATAAAIAKATGGAS